MIATARATGWRGDHQPQEIASSADAFNNALANAMSPGNGYIQQVVESSGSNRPGNSTMPLIPATFPNCQGIVDIRTGGPLLIPQTVSQPETTRRELVKGFTDYVDRHPESCTQEFSVVIIIALRSQYPCRNSE
jgi:hypothetical protein